MKDDAHVARNASQMMQSPVQLMGIWKAVIAAWPTSWPWPKRRKKPPRDEAAALTARPNQNRLPTPRDSTGILNLETGEAGRRPATPI
ncbi:MAG: hypothetical protein VB835_05080 [Pirellulales bacterium]